MKVGVLGAQGRMGKMVCEEAVARNWEVIALSFDKSVLEIQLKTCNIVIEFSSKSGVELLLEIATIPLVLATTGLDEAIKEKIALKSKHLPIFYSANYSRGLFILLDLLKKSGLSPQAATICETHHIHKKDAPSGTALTIQSFLEIPSSITSVRKDEVVGEHEITYKLQGEELVFKHVALGREVFAKGACDAAVFILTKGCALFSMEDLTLG